MNALNIFDNKQDFLKQLGSFSVIQRHSWCSEALYISGTISVYTILSLNRMFYSILCWIEKIRSKIIL